MKKIITSALFIVTFFAFSQQKNNAQPKTFSTKDRTVTVYTTAENTKLRLSKTDNLKFS